MRRVLICSLVFAGTIFMKEVTVFEAGIQPYSAVVQQISRFECFQIPVSAH